MIQARKSMLCTASLLLVGCGGATAAATAATPPTAAQRGGPGGGTSGQLVQIAGTTLTISTANGDVKVTYTSATPITQTSTGSTADIVTGSCVVIGGTKDSSGAVTATTVRLTAAVNGACTSANNARPGGGGSFPARPTGAAVPSGAPTPNPNAAFLAGLVTGVSGTSVTVQEVSGATSVVTVPTTVVVNESHAASAADLVLDICLLARGAKASDGVVAATTLTIEPAAANGTCTVIGFGGGRGFGGGGGGGFGGGFGGGTPPAGG